MRKKGKLGEERKKVEEMGKRKEERGEAMEKGR